MNILGYIDFFLKDCRNSLKCGVIRAIRLNSCNFYA